MSVGLESWCWTVAAQEGLWLAMDDETADLIQMLCARAGMIMEDCSAEALMGRPTDPQGLSEKLERLAQTADTICAIVAAARALNRSDRDT